MLCVAKAIGGRSTVFDKRDREKLRVLSRAEMKFVVPYCWLLIRLLINHFFQRVL